MAIICKVVGHASSGEKTPIYGWEGVIYFADICPRCGKRQPVSEEDARKKAANTAQIAAIMNGERARLRLAPISWED